VDRPPSRKTDCQATRSARICGVFFDDLTSGKSLFQFHNRNFIGLAFPFRVFGKLVSACPDQVLYCLPIHTTYQGILRGAVGLSRRIRSLQSEQCWVVASDLPNLLISSPIVPVKAESHSMRGAPRMQPPQMPDILPLTQPHAAIDAETAPTALEIILPVE